MPRPYLVDNRSDETTHAAALRALVEWARDPQLSIATAYVNLGGLHTLAEIAEARSTRLLIGSAPDPGLGAQIPVERFEITLGALTMDRDLARFPPSRAARDLAAVETWLQQSDVEVRRFVQDFLHGKAYLFGQRGDAEAALVTSANLTAAGLFRNLELGLTHYDPVGVNPALEWFEDLWDQADDFKPALLDLLFPSAQVLDPQTIYLRALLELYGDELDAIEMVAPPSAVHLAPFQRDGYERARAILSRFHGVIYADGVGTGKTEIGLAFIEEYALRRGQQALIVCPAQLKRNWIDRLNAARLPAQVISFQELATDEQLAPDAPHRRRILSSLQDSYRLVIVDEGHALRSAGTRWYRSMERLLGGEQKDLVLLTATPINNGLWDLYNLVMLFARHDTAFAPQGIGSVRGLFLRAGANERDPENLNPDVLFPLADLVSVRRDRTFIQDHYPDAVFPDGTPVRFPTPLSETVRYDLDESHAGLFAEITAAVEQLTMARYRPSAYEIGGVEAVDEHVLSGLLQSGVLKRFESSWWACLRTVERMLYAHDAFLAAWDQGTVPSRTLLYEAARAEVDDAGAASWVLERLESDPGALPVSAYRPEFRADVAADRTRLRTIRDRLGVLTPADDPKLARLREVLETTQARKVAVFATFGETIAYLNEHLPATVGGRGRVTVIGGETDPDERTAALGRFCPDTVIYPHYEPPGGEVDLLLSTDVLSEGQNLQQAAQVISYDMPWNPQRVVQRYGRVIRLKSPHSEVTLTTMLPEPGELEALLGLEATIRRKILAATLYGMDAEVVEGTAFDDLRAFAAQLADGDPALLDDDTRTAPTAFAGEELRAELLRAFSEGEVTRLRSLPWGIGSAFHQGLGIPSRGPRGVFFACRAKGRRYWRYVDVDRALTEEDAEMLRRINPGNAHTADPTFPGFEEMWAAAVASIVDEHNELARPQGSERVGPAQRFALDLLRDPVVAIPDGAEEAEEALVVERSSTVRQALNAIRADVDSGHLSREAAAARVVATVREFGLRAVPPPPPVEPITTEDVGVVCWMVVLAPSRPG